MKSILRIIAVGLLLLAGSAAAVAGIMPVPLPPPGGPNTAFGSNYLR